MPSTGGKQVCVSLRLPKQLERSEALPWFDAEGSSVVNGERT